MGIFFIESTNTNTCTHTHTHTRTQKTSLPYQKQTEYLKTESERSWRNQIVLWRNILFHKKLLPRVERRKKVKVIVWLFDPKDYTVHGILQAFSFSRGSSQPKGQTQVSLIAGGFFTSWATREAQEY